MYKNSFIKIDLIFLNEIAPTSVIQQYTDIHSYVYVCLYVGCTIHSTLISMRVATRSMTKRVQCTLKGCTQNVHEYNHKAYIDGYTITLYVLHPTCTILSSVYMDMSVLLMYVCV